MEQSRLSAPVRVLLVSADRRFRLVMHFLLERAGFAIETVSDPTALLAEGRLEPGVVIVDTAHGDVEALRIATATASAHAEVAVLVVAERPELVSSGATLVLPKWGPFDRLVGAIRSEASSRAPEGLVVAQGQRLVFEEME